MQSALLQHHQFGVLTRADVGLGPAPGHVESAAMPIEWVKATMLVRANSVSRGHSAVTLNVIKLILKLVRNSLIPVVPLRGSISASGDLSPLSYVAGAVTGNPDIYVQSRCGVITAKQALEEIQVQPAKLGPKEGLGLMNGTAVSSAVASLALYEAHHLVLLSQVLTAMACEALMGSATSFHPFVAHVRPHRGQTEAAKNIRLLLHGSRLTRSHGDAIKSRGLLYQDRYALRTASQWIGPQLEDLMLAHEQVSVELNSTTDNPLIDVQGHQTHHCGNFQAVSITSAMEKTRSALQMTGKLMFSQCTELINPMVNNGLPPNLAADEPSVSFTMKGVDIGMASYMSELAYLANPVSSHVQSAEMHNQAINSLAFISARYTCKSVDLVSLMGASYLYTVCQALDLRVFQMITIQKMQRRLPATVQSCFGNIVSDVELKDLTDRLCDHVESMWYKTTHQDTTDRCRHIIETSLPLVTETLLLRPNAVRDQSRNLQTISHAISDWKTVKISLDPEHLQDFDPVDQTPQFLARGTVHMYLYIRETLGIPFHRGLVDHPAPEAEFDDQGNKKRTIGSWISVIYEALRDGRLHEPLMDALMADTDMDGSVKADTNGTVKVETNGSVKVETNGLE